MSRICFVRQHYFPQDQRVRNQVEALLAEGNEVDVLCQRRPGQPLFERRDGLTVWRMPLAHHRGGKLSYVLQYGIFFALATLFLAVFHCIRRYKLVAIVTMPDALVFSAIVPRLTGARILLDLRETMPEFYATKYGVGMDHIGVRVVAWLERASIRFAHQSVTCTAQMRNRFIERGADPKRIGVIMVSADEDVFSVKQFVPEAKAQGGFTLISHGAIEERYGIDTAIEAVALLGNEIPGLRLEIYGEGTHEPALRELAERLGVGAMVRFNGFVPLEALLKAIAEADAGLVAIKRDMFRDLVHCVKMFEYIAMRKPVISSRTKAVEECFDDASLLYFEDSNPRDLARAIRRLHSEPQLGEALVRQATRVNREYRWERQRESFLSMLRPFLGVRAA